MKNFRFMLVIIVTLALNVGLLSAQSMGDRLKDVKKIFDEVNKKIPERKPAEKSAPNTNTNTSIAQTATTELKIGRDNNITLERAATPYDFKIIVPEAGNMTLSYEFNCNQAAWAIYDQYGNEVPNSGEETITGGNQRGRRWASGFAASLGQNDAYFVQWNDVSKMSKGTVTYTIDAGIYYLRVARDNTGLSRAVIGLTLTNLYGGMVGQGSNESYAFPTQTAEPPVNPAAVKTSVSTPQTATTKANPHKFALVIGNADYTSAGKLRNPVNDAVDMKETLETLGFQVEIITNGNLQTMQDGVLRFRNRLSVHSESYGLFFYAGHGVQSGTEMSEVQNYLIPVDADIPSEEFLPNRSMSMQASLGAIQSAGNALNIVILDACRNNPFSWARSGSRGLAVVANQPPGSIIIYATSAGSIAEDGVGRNGTFTTELLKNLREPGINVNELIDRVGLGVQQATGGKQNPAIYKQFFGTAYLGEIAE